MYNSLYLPTKASFYEVCIIYLNMCMLCMCVCYMVHPNFKIMIKYTQRDAGDFEYSNIICKYLLCVCDDHKKEGGQRLDIITIVYILHNYTKYAFLMRKNKQTKQYTNVKHKTVFDKWIFQVRHGCTELVLQNIYTFYVIPKLVCTLNP